MATDYDFVIVGGGSAGAALAARLSEDPSITVALLEAGGKPPQHEAMPMACAALQLDPETDWMYRGDPGKGGQGFQNRTMPIPRGKMLGGSSGINYMVFVRGHPGDYDNWAARGPRVGAFQMSNIASNGWKKFAHPTKPTSTATAGANPAQLGWASAHPSYRRRASS